MTKTPSFFQSAWYHFIMSAIYITAGIILIVKGNSGDQTVQPVIVGWLLCGYGGYRLVSRLIKSKFSDKQE